MEAAAGEHGLKNPGPNLTVIGHTGWRQEEALSLYHSFGRKEIDSILFEEGRI